VIVYKNKKYYIAKVLHFQRINYINNLCIICFQHCYKRGVDGMC